MPAPAPPSLHTTLRGDFRRLYRRLERSGALAHTPVLFCEGDSWFSTPLAMNLLDWIVYPSAPALQAGVPLIGSGGLFFRAERNGERAIDMFATSRLDDLARWLGGFRFDLVLLSAGGNDLVGRFLAERFRGCAPMTVEQALTHVLDSGRLQQVHDAYARALQRFDVVQPGVPVLAHSYDYPQRMGVAAELTLANIGLAALLGKQVGDWIAGHLRHCLPSEQAQRDFARRLIDAWVAQVLEPLKQRFPQFDYVDFRGTLDEPSLWFDELHPTGEGFRLLAERYRAALLFKLPVEKVRAVG